MRRIAMLGLAAGMMMGAAAEAATTKYEVTVLSGGFTARGLSNSGHVVGYGNNGRGVRWLASNGYTPEYDANSSGMRAVNENGDAVGTADGMGSGYQSRYWSASSGSSYGMGGRYGNGINDDGDAVGWSGNSYSIYARWLPGANSVTTSGAANTRGNDINNNDVSVGWFHALGVPNAGYWTGTAGGWTSFNDQNAYRSDALSINDANATVGYIIQNNGEDQRAVLWDTLTSMPVFLDSGSAAAGDRNIAWGINASEQVVGSYGSGSTQRAFIWTAANGLVDLTEDLLDPAPWSRIGTAFAINDQGWIVGDGYDDQGGQYAVLLKPVDVQDDSAVPAQGLLGVLVLGAAAAFRRR